MRKAQLLGRLKGWQERIGTRFQSFFIVLLFIGLLTFFFYDVTFQGKTFKVTTMHAQAMPYGPYGQADNYGSACPLTFRDSAAWEETAYQFFKQYFAQGIFPFWDPHQAYGSPSAVYFFVGALFPLTFLIYLLPNIISWDILILSRLLIAGLSMYWLMRVLGFRFIVRMIAACSFMLSGPLVVCQATQMTTYIMLPLLMGSVYKVFHDGRLKNFLFFSLIVALNGFAGSIEDMFLVGLFTAGYLVFLFYQQRKTGAIPVMRTLVKISLFSVLGVAIAGITLVPFLAEFFRGWNDHPPFVGQLFEEARKYIVTLVIPNFFSDKLVSLPTFERNVWNGGYFGILFLGMTIMSAWNKKRRALVLFLGVIAILMLGQMFGLAYASWIGHVPVLGMVRLSSGRLAHPFAFLLAILAGIGLEAILNMSKCFNKLALVFFGLASYVTSQLWIYHHTPFFDQSLRASVVAFGFLAVALLWVFILESKGRGRFAFLTAFGLLFLLLAELFSYAPRCRPNRFDSFPRVPYIDFLKNDMGEMLFRVKGLGLMFSGNTAGAYGVDGIDISCVILPMRYVNFSNRFLSKRPKLGSKEAVAEEDVSFEKRIDIFAATNVKYLVADPGPGGGDRVVYNKEAKIFVLPFTAPRAYVACDFEVFPWGADEKIYDRIDKDPSSLVRKVILEKKPEESLPTPSLPGSGLLFPAEIQMYGPNRIEISASVPRAGALVLLDAYHPDWKAWVDGVPVKIYPANYLFRAVFLPAGEHKAVFRFVPVWFYVGGAMTLIGLGIWSVLFFRKS